MLSMVFALLGGWILSLFGFDTVVIDGAKELFHISITTAGYYLIFAILGLIFAFLGAIRG
ncbi:hypothetical protein NUG13_11760 [Bacillus subtilis]|uniref:Uncharacterized protein n=1 Tax=Bacillus phage FADO TaxID=2917160 RepID=A0AAE9GE03_9CAUD|nr:MULTISPECIES: hypothetical protein [Bacillus subtilis group]YP_010740204.1 hypothetical protein P9294_gp187 [Bacillus phage FADO]MCR4362003.1 hypothetical protein [Bacillus subtilis]UNY48902.1 hypothetical protein fado_187 [Bacillus phage FADO]UQB84378.1 hypothetical protein KMZ31_19860 [Bacillus amyloliquefaciens]